MRDLVIDAILLHAYNDFDFDELESWEDCRLLSYYEDCIVREMQDLLD